MQKPASALKESSTESPVCSGLILPVGYFDGRLWARGKVDEMELFRELESYAPRAGCLIILSLFGGENVRPMMRRLIAWHRLGVRSLAFRTGNPLVVKWGLENGCVQTFTEPDGRGRFYAEGDTVTNWLRKFSRKL